MIPVQITPLTPVVPTVPAPAVTTGSISENAPYIPPVILSLPPGSLVKGFVLNRDSNGNPILRSNVGDFLIQSNFFLRIGSNVTVRIESSGGNVRAAIIEVDGKPVQAGEAPPRQNAPAEEDIITRNPLTQSVQNVAPNRQGAPQVLNAVLLTAPQGQPALIKPGTALLLNVLSLQLPSSASSTTTLNPRSPSPPPASLSATAATGATTANPAPASTLSTSEQTSVNTPPLTTSYTPPSQIAQTPTVTPHIPATQGQTQTLLVIGQEKDGEPILQTPFGLIKITSNVTLPSGTQLVANLQQLASLQPQALTSNTANNLPLVLSDLAQGWQSFKDILSLFQTTDGISKLGIALQLPQIQLSQTQIQAPVQQFNAGLFVFLAALKGGDFRNWIGEARAKAIEELGHGALLNKAEGEFALMSRLFTEATGQQWQNVFLPVLVNGELQMVRYFSKRDRRKDENGRPTQEGHTRFIVEVTLSELGEMQLDGFYRRQTQERYLELIIRAHQPLDLQVQHDIIGIYQNLTEAAGLQGSLAFQWLRDFPIHPLDDIIGEPPEIVV